MLRPIQLDDQFCFRAVEIDDIRRDRTLTAELQPVETTATQPIPQGTLRIGHLFAQCLRGVSRASRQWRIGAPRYHRTLIRRYAPPSPEGRRNRIEPFSPRNTNSRPLSQPFHPVAAVQYT